jgi:phytoene synthase
MSVIARESTMLDEARMTTERVARTFALACRLLPPDVRDDVYLLYLVFRLLDDAVDEGQAGAERRVAAVEAWAQRKPAEVTREVEILGKLAGRHPIPRDALTDFCAGMRSDLAGERYRTETDVDRYCYRVAGTVGVVMASILGMRDPVRARPAAAALGMAMQRTNILRDIDEDLAGGRLFLAEETVARFGWPNPGEREELLRHQIARAEALYEQGGAGIPELVRGRRAVAAAAGMYREILRQIEREGYGARPGRAVVSKPRKVVAAARQALRIR